MNNFLELLIKAAPTKVDESKEVPYLAGYSKDGKCIYIDKRLPKMLKLKDGREVRVDKYLEVHESTEKQLEDTKGYKYQYAHEKATGAERKAVEADGIPWDEYQNYMLSEVKKLTKLDGKVPKDIDLKPEHDYNDKAMIKEVNKLKKSIIEILSIPFESDETFLDRLIKAGKTGEGSRGGKIVGHTKSGEPIYDKKGDDPNRKPYPGEEAWKLGEINPKKTNQTYMPPEGTSHHYSDTPALRAYKNIIRGFKQKGIPFQGHITFDPKTQAISTISASGAKIVKELVTDFEATQGGAPKSGSK